MPLHAQLQVQVEFDGGSWTDVTSWVRSASGRRGRSNEFENVNAGTARVQLSNADRRFDPEYEDGPWYGKLKPRRRIRIGFAWADHNTYGRRTAARSLLPYVYWQFYGYVDGWPQSYNGPRDAVVNLTATDAFGLWARQHVPSVWQQTMEAESPAVWFRVGEQSGTSAADASGNKRHGAYEGGAVFNSRGGLVFGENDNAIEFRDGNRLTTPWYPTSYPFSIEMWILAEPNDPDSTSARYLFRFANNKGTSTVTDDERIVATIQPDSDTGFGGTVDVAVATDNSNFYRVNSGVVVDDGQIHHLVFTASAADALLLYVDGVLRTSVRDDVGTVTTPPFTGGVTSGIGNRNEPEDFPALAVIDEFVMYTSTLSAATVLAHYEAGSAPWEGDTAGQRFGRLLDYINWPEAWRDIDLTSAVLIAATLDTNLVDHAQAVETSEGGRVFITRDGLAALVGRQNMWADAVYNTANAVFGDGAGELGYAMRSGDLFDYDDTKIVNEARVRQYGATEQVAADAASQADYGLMSRSEATLEARPGVVLNRAEYLVYKHADPAVRVPAITLKPERDPDAYYTTLLAADLAWRYTVKRRPQSVGSAISKDVQLEGVEWSATPGDVEFTWELSPGEPEFWILDTSTLETGTHVARIGY